MRAIGLLPPRPTQTHCLRVLALAFTAGKTSALRSFFKYLKRVNSCVTVWQLVSRTFVLWLLLGKVSWNRNIEKVEKRKNKQFQGIFFFVVVCFLKIKFMAGDMKIIRKDEPSAFQSTYITYFVFMWGVRSLASCPSVCLCGCVWGCICLSAMRCCIFSGWRWKATWRPALCQRQAEC